MRPLRLQIVVQPRVLPSPSNPAPSEPVIKWLEVCTGDPTIQELSETLEKRFLQRNHRPLNIKILKFLDDIELFPDNKVRDIFEDVKDAKHGDIDLSIVKVYRNPPTTVELADPRRFESLPPDSLARPIKRPPSPHLRRPPPPLFADAVRNEIHNPFDRRDPQLDQFEDGLQAPNKRRKIQSFRTTAYTNDPDQAIDSRELADDGHVYSQTAHQHPSQDAQVEDSQTSPPRKRSDPYGTPISSQISQQEGGKSREVEMVSVPDSPPDRALTRSRESLQLSTAFRDSRSCSPELPSSLGRLSQLQEAPTRTQYSKSMPQIRQSPKRPIEAQVQPPALLAVGSKAVSPVREPDSLLQPEEAQYETDTPILPVQQTGRPELPEATLKALRMPPREVSSEVFTMLEPNRSKQGPLIVEIPKSFPSKSSGGKGADGRLKRPNLLKSVRAPQRTPRLINGIRQNAPSITDVFDPIETSGGSSCEHDLVRTTKRMKSTAPKQNAKGTALQQAAIANSLIVRLRIPESIQPRSSSLSLPGVSRDRTTVDTQQNLKAASTRESRHPTVDDKVRNSTMETPIMVPTNVSTRQSSDPYNAEAVSNVQDQSFTEPVNFDPRSAPPGKYRQPSNTVTPEQRVRAPANNNAVETVGRSTHTSGDEMSDGLLERQLREKREVKEKAQADFDRITALQRKRQGLQESKASHLAAEPSDISSVIKEPTSSALALSKEAKRVYSSDDLEAKRKHGLKQLASTRKQYFKDTEPVDTPQAKQDQKSTASAESKLKKVQAEARKEARRAKEQKDKETRMAIAKGMDEQKRRELEEKNQRQVEAGIAQERMEANQEAVTAIVPKQKGIKMNEAAQTTNSDEKQSSQKIKGQVPDSQRTEDSTRAKNHVEATDADRNKAKVMTPIDQASSSPSKLPERSPKARLNAQRQLQIANQVFKYPKHELEIIKRAPAVIANAAKPRARAPKSQKKTGVKQATNKSRETQALNEQRESDTANHVDHAALQAARAGLSVMTRPTTTASKRSGTATAGSDPPKVTALSLSAKGTREVPKDQSIRSSSSSLSRGDPDRARTMTPAFPSSSMQRNPESAEARARRTASVGTKTPITPSRSALHTTPSASRRSVSFAGGSIISQLHEGKTVDQDSTPTSSGQTFLLNGVGKTPTRTKQTKMSQHIDRKLKGKAIDPSSPVRAVAENEEIIISSASEASTFYSDESEGERNARAGPSSRKKVKPQNSSLASASGPPLINPSSSHAALNRMGPRPITGSQIVPNGPQAAETPSARVVQISGARSSQSKAQSDSESGSESASVTSTDDVSNLPPITGTKQGLLSPNTRTNGNHEPRTPSNRDQNVAVNAARVRNEERLQIEADQQLQREYSEALQPKTTINTQPSKLENSKTVNGVSEQMARPPVRAEHEKYGSRVRINPNFDTSSLSQLRKVQAATQMSDDRNPKSVTSHKPHIQSFMDSSSASDSGESTSSGSIEELDPVKKAPGTMLNSAPQKNRFPGVWKDLFGREGGTKT
ncbi:MAG: hypothetical protein Q9178_007502 [Gyalolechia marmorata]